ncbi:hypothetical protein EI94DRAFT_622617 [Lactarius quietus]|nr:hypothetical protein EI94DRAFT_622617 [Lactarius quietus]
MSIDIEAPSAHELDTSPSASETTLPRIRLKLGLPPGTATTVSVGKTSGNPPPRAPPPAPVPITDPSPIVQETSITPDSTASHNIRLEHSLALAEKKRKLAEDKLPSNKKPKCTPTALAIPPEGNTIRNICMRRWNEQQPRGQGLATDFDVYFKALTEAEKEPFKREMQAVKGAKKGEECLETNGEYNAHQLTPPPPLSPHILTPSRHSINSPCSSAQVQYALPTLLKTTQNTDSSPLFDLVVHWGATWCISASHCISHAN